MAPAASARNNDSLAAAITTALGPLVGIRVAYLFGSRARGDSRDDSDLDVAVSYDAADDRVRETVRRAIVAALTDALGRVGERADVVDLERADSAVAFRAIREGRLVLSRSQGDRVRIESRVGRRYDDDAPKRALFRRAAQDAVARMQKP
jgi:predicted nucleotidyltransferase